MSDFEDTGLPKGVIITDDGAVRYYWREWGMSTIWILLGLMFTGAAIITTGGTIIYTLLCSIPIFWIPGLGLLYLGVGKAINCTEFRVESGELIVQHKPLPWRGSKSIPTMEIDKVSVESRAHEGGTVYDLVIVTNNGGSITPISGLNLDNSDAIVRELERALGKPHQPDTEKHISALRERASKDKIKKMQQMSSLTWMMPIVLLLSFIMGIFLTFGAVKEMKEWRRSQSWPSVTGTVINTKIDEIRQTSNEGDVFVSYTLQITYQYSVNGIIYTSDRIGFNRQPSYSFEEGAQKAYNAYAPNGRVIVYYDPDRPDHAILDPKLFDYKDMTFGSSLIVLSVIGIPLVIFFRKRYTRKAGKNIPRD